MMLVIFFTALLSLASYLYCWNDIRRGRPHIISLRQVTLIMDRNALNRLFGQPQPDYRYALPLETLARLIKAKQGYVYLEMAADALCMLGAWRYLTGAAPEALEEWFILLAALCQGVNIVYSMWLVWKWGDQIREEMEDLGD